MRVCNLHAEPRHIGSYIVEALKVVSIVQAVRVVSIVQAVRVVRVVIIVTVVRIVRIAKVGGTVNLLDSTYW